MMNKRELAAEMAERSGLTLRDAERALNAAMESIVAALAAGEEVQIKGFGSFARRARAARMGYNPSTKEMCSIPASYAPAFKPGKRLKDAVVSADRSDP